MGWVSRILGAKRSIKQPTVRREAGSTSIWVDIGSVDAVHLDDQFREAANSLLERLGCGGEFWQIMIEPSSDYWGSTPHEFRQGFMKMLLQHIEVHESGQMFSLLEMEMQDPEKIERLGLSKEELKSALENGQAVRREMKEKTRRLRHAIERCSLRLLVGTLGKQKIVGVLMLYK